MCNYSQRPREARSRASASAHGKWAEEVPPYGGIFQRVDKPHPCHSEEYPKGTCFAARSDVGIRIFSDRNLRKAQNLCVLETDCRASVRTGSQ